MDYPIRRPSTQPQIGWWQFAPVSPQPPVFTALPDQGQQAPASSGSSNVLPVLLGITLVAALAFAGTMAWADARATQGRSHA